MKQAEFDFKAGQDLARRGLEKATAKRRSLLGDPLAVMRQVARRVALSRAPDMRLTIDAVFHYAKLWHGLEPADLGPAAGAVFRERCWEKAGRKPTTRVSNHAREVTIWRYLPHKDPKR